MSGNLENPIPPQHNKGEENHLLSKECTDVQKALWASEHHLRAITEQAGAGILMCDLTGAFTCITSFPTNLFGYTKEELYGMKIQDLVSTEYQPKLQYAFHHLLTENTTVQNELPLVCKNQSDLWVNMSISLVKDSQQKPAFCIFICQSTHPYKQASAEKENQSFDILESLSDAVFVVDDEWRFTYVNRKAAELNNRKPGNVIGKIIWDEFPNLKESAYGQLYLKVAEEKKPSSVVAQTSFNKRWYEVYAAPGKNGMVAHFKDVTEQVETEAALRKSEDNYRTLFNSIDEGFCIIEILFDENRKPQDYRFLEYNRHFEEMTGLRNAVGKTALELLPDLEPFWIHTYGNVALTGEPVRFENYSESMSRYFDVFTSRVGDAGSRKVAIVFTNVTERKLIERDRDRFLALGSDLQAIAGGNERFLWVSSAWEKVLGYSVKELTTLSWKQLVHPDDLERTAEAARQNLAGEELVSWENRYRHKNGTYRWFSWNSKPFTKENCTYGVAIDITDRKEAEEALRESEERYSAIIHQATAGVSEMDLAGNHLFVNKKLCEMTGFTEEELCEQKFFDYVHPDDRGHCIKLFQQTVETGKPFINEKRIIGKDKTEIWINETISSISDANNKTKSVVSVCIDNTDRKTIEKQKDEFIGVVSHELKTPVTSLKAYAQVLQFRFTSMNDLTSADMLKKMEKQINRLSLLIQDLLDVTKLEGKLMAFHPRVFSFKQMVENTIEEVQRTIPSHTIVCNAVPDGLVYADEERTAQVLVNFLTNAAKYSPGASQIIVWVSISSLKITCSVEDFGIGIPAESQKYIFDRFYRVSDSSRSTYPGLGLGLYISSEIVKRQGGEIWFKSLANEGSVFSFRLPLYLQS